MNLRRACEHGRYEQHWEEIGAICSGGTEPTIDELLTVVFERLSGEGATDKEIGVRIGQAIARALMATQEVTL